MSSTLVKAAVEQGRIFLANSKQVSIQDPLFEARLFMQSVLDVTAAQYILKCDDAISSEDYSRYMSYIEQRATGKPVAYILGKTGFWTLELMTNSHTLIPRSETELLVEWAISLTLYEKARVLDLGTGTGAIALSLASEKQSWQVYGVDRIQGAVHLAEQNAKLNGLSAQFLQSDWFSVFEQDKLGFDLIVSNPPYVEESSEYLHQGDLRFEPRSALVAANSGLADIKQIVAQSPQYLNAGGWLGIEHGFEQHNAVQTLLDESGFSAIKTIKDLNNLPRVTVGQFR
ncbi:peptide chain release factor N(5)-glutamine methyltransferase [Agaribacter flavus]|uniref:Release factor glutamine methyltransferase n=1 Tax=Agaribacter flavus TaxID=1902781 RepID=A0ABV7FJW7_9ALTE